MKNTAITLLEICNHIASHHPEIKEQFLKINPNSTNINAADMAHFNLFREWQSRQFSMPCPNFIKQAHVLRQGISNATWIETGTYLGDTTALLAASGNQVYTIEPGENLYDRAVKRFENAPHVHVINDLSENVLPKLLPTLSGNVNFWLDGHFSAGTTHKGPIDTPLVEELQAVSDSLRRFEKVVILIDDIRSCDDLHSDYNPTYPSLDYLVDWARENKFSWRVELDSFIAKRI